jgi:hypothetical protein
MKLIGFIAVLMATGALASELPNPVAKYTKSNQPKDPMYAYRTECAIYEDRVFHVTVGTMITPDPQYTDVVYTQEIPDYATALRAVRAANKGNVIFTGPESDHLPNESYEGVLTIGAGAPFDVLLASQGKRNMLNLSKAAMPLIRFIQANCSGQ